MKYRPIFFGRFFRPAAALVSFAGLAQAADQIWTGATDGLWSSGTNWGGNAAPGAVSGVGSGDTATFNNALNTGITVDVYRNIKNLTFDTGAGAFTLSSGLLVLTNAGAITLNSGVINTQTINTNIQLSTTAASTYIFINNSTTAGAKLNFGGTISGQAVQTLTLGGANGGTISGVIGNGTGTVSLTKASTGTWNLNGSAVNTYTGTTSVNGGTLALDFANLAAPTNLINSGSALSMGGGTLSILGKSGVATSQTFTSLTMAAGASKISITPGASSTAGLTITTLNTPANTVRGCLQFSATGTTTLSNKSSATSFQNAALNLYATYGTDDWAATNASGVVQAATYSAAPTAFTAGTINNVTGSFTNATTDPLAIRFADPIGRTVTQNDTSFFIGGILVANTSGTAAISGSGTIRPFGSSTQTNTDFNIIQNSTNAFTVGVAINNNATGRNLGLVKSGVGNLIITAANGYSGGTYINEGTLQVGNGSTTGILGTGGVVNFGSLIFNRSNDFSDTNAISGSGSVTKEGTGALIRNAASTYTGATTVNAGVLEVGHATALGNGTVAVNSGRLALNNGLTLANNIMVNGGILSPNNGTSTYSGTVAIGASGATVDARNWYDTTGQNVAFTNTISGAGALTKTGLGDLTLSVSNTYAGGTTISAGKIIAGNGSALGTGPVAIGSGTTLSSSNANLAIGALTLSGGGNISLGTVANMITSSGAVNISGTNNLLTLGGSAATAGNTYTLISGTSLSVSGISLAGTAVGGSTVALGSTSTVGRTNYAFGSTATALQLSVTGGTFNLLWNGGNANWNTTDALWLKDGAGSNITFFTGDNVTISTPDSIAVDAGGVTSGTMAVNTATGIAMLTGGAILAASLTKSGAGTLQIENAVTATGAATISAGTLTLGLNGTLTSGTNAVSGGTLDIGANDKSLANLSLTSGSITGTTGILTATGSAIAAQSGSISAILGGGVGLTKSTVGSVVLSANNTYTGVTTINSGTLQIGNGGTAGSIANTSGVTNNATLAYNRSDALTAGYVHSGTGAVVKDGVGTLTLTNDNTYFGSTTINAGTLQIGNGGSAGSIGNTSGITDNGILAFNRSDALNVGNAITGSGSVVKDGAGTLTLSILNNYAGGTTVNAGVLTLGNGGAAGSGAVTLKDATRLNFSTGNGGAQTIFTGSNVIVSGANANASLSSSNSASGWSGSVAGSADQTFTISPLGGQQVNMNGTTKQLQNFSGTVNVSGTLRFSASTLGGAGNVNGSDNALFNVTGFMSTRNEGAVSLGALSGNGTINGGSIADGNNPPGNTFTIGARGTDANFTGIIQNGSANAVSVVKTGSGIQTFSGANLYTGTTSINGGTLELPATGSLASSAVAISGGTLLLGGGTGDRLSNTGSVTLGNAASDSILQLNNTVSETAGPLSLSAGGAGRRVIDFGSVSGVLNFTSLLTNASPLQVWNWSGNVGTGGGTDQFIVNTTDSFSNVFFFSDSGVSPLGTAAFATANPGELVPVPEPGALFAGLALLAPLAWRERRQWMRCREARRMIPG